MRKSYVYKITCKITGEFYFGSSFRAKSDYYWGGGKRIRERIAQYGKENFVKEILGEFDDRTIAHQVENQYIEKFINDDKCMNKHLDHKFRRFNEEFRTKSGAANRGEKSPWYGKHLSYETRSKLSAALRGKTFSEEHKAKLSAAMRGNKNVLGKHWRKNPVTGKREWYD